MKPAIQARVGNKTKRNKRSNECFSVLPKLLILMERETGIEPATSSLGSWHSTAELLPPLSMSRQCH